MEELIWAFLICRWVYAIFKNRKTPTSKPRAAPEPGYNRRRSRYKACYDENGKLTSINVDVEIVDIRK